MRLRRALLISPSLTLLGLVGSACSGGVSVQPGVLPTVDGGGVGADAGDGGLPAGAGVGQACDDTTTKCRPGLACTNGTCAPGHSSPDGTPCVINAECKQGSYCGPQRTCTPGGAGTDGSSCASDGDCASGLRCNIVGLGAECQPEGTGDVGGACKLSNDCFGGLACVSNVCAQLPPGVPPLGVPGWKGVDCPADVTPVTAYFRVPRGSNDGDFFRLPFPNDVRRKADGHPDYSSFPTPGSDLLGFDAVDRYARYVEQHTDGFSNYPTITLRFSGTIDFDSLKTQGAVHYVDLTTGNELGYGWSATTGRSPYVCPNSLAVRPPQGAPLKSGGTYALVLTNTVKATGGGAVQPSADFTALLGASAPSDTALASAYAAYAPLRAWAASKSFDLGTAITGTVFTVAHATDTAQKLATAVNAAALPTASGWVKCGPGVASPCPQATGDRACGNVDPAFDELHALVKLPIFQQGTAPYLTPADGGDIAVDGTGTPQLQRTEDVCMALTVPKGTAMPGGGWPLVIYAHGTGGSFRSHINEGVAARLASVDDGSGGQVHMAVLGIDQVEHGPRRGSSTQSPDNLFFNFANPAAARGNPLQGAADQMALARFAKSINLAAASSPTGADIQVGALAFWGHSQGATEGAIAMPYTAGPLGALLSGEGASLIDALVHKTSPVNIAAALPFVLADPHVGTSHPVLTLLQNAIDPADPLNHAVAIASAPGAGLGKHVFMPYGQKDTYAPVEVQQTYALAAKLGLIAAAPSVTTPDAIGGLTPVAAPASANLNGNLLSGFVREYAPTTQDGHFVVFDDPNGKKDADHFLADVLLGKVPQIAR